MKANKTLNPKTAHKYISTNCSFCGKQIYRSKNTIKNGISPICSEECKTFLNDPKQSKMMDLINDNNFYYLIGLIATDGYIKYPGCGTKQNNYACVIKLCTKDAIILENIQRVFGGIIKTENHNKTTSWYISNRNFIQYLNIVVGLTNHKTHNINVTYWFNTLSDNQKQAFIRGVIDGDGGIYSSQTNTFRCHAMICSASFAFINMICSYIGGHISMRKKEDTQHLKIKATCDLYYLRLSGNLMLNLENIYNIKDTDLVMPRKYFAYKTISQHLSTKLYK